MPTDSESTDNDAPTTDTDGQPTEHAGDWPGVERRPLLKALGVGATLSLGSGVTAAESNAAEWAAGERIAEQDAIEQDTTEQDEAEIDPRYGLSVAKADEIPDNLQPAHEVRLEVTPPDPQAGTPPRFFFEPSGLHVSRGDVVQFTFSTPDHTVTAYHPVNGFQRRIPEAAPPFSSPVVNVGGAWLYRFDQPGVYDVYCGPHHAFGMVGRLVVGDVSEDQVPAYEDTFEGSQNPPLLAPYSRQMLEGELEHFSDRNQDVEWVWLTPGEVLDADALDPMRIQDAGSVPFAAVREELLGDGTESTTTT